MVLVRVLLLEPHWEQMWALHLELRWEKSLAVASEAASGETLVQSRATWLAMPWGSQTERVLARIASEMEREVCWVAKGRETVGEWGRRKGHVLAWHSAAAWV